MREPIAYFDYAATTPVDPLVAKEIYAFLASKKTFGNPSSKTHAYGDIANELINEAETELLSSLNLHNHKTIWLSGATEANNMVILSSNHTTNHIITTVIEHHSVLEPCKKLEAAGHQVTYLKVDASGRINLNELKQSLKPKTSLVSIMQVNNELGVIQDLKAITKIIGDTKALLHVDAAQSIGKIKHNLENLDIDFISLSAHKTYGPKGIGALIAKETSLPHLKPLIMGGNQQNMLRAGTLPTHQIIGMTKAFTLSAKLFEEEYHKYKKFREIALNELGSINNLKLNASHDETAPSIISFTLSKMDAELFLSIMHDYALSLGAACSSISNNIEPSHVLLAIGKSRREANNTIRLSFGRYTKEQHLLKMLQKIKDILKD